MDQSPVASEARSEAARRTWRDPDIRARRSAAIRAALIKTWDDPLRLALARKPGSVRSSREAYNAYHRAYNRAWRRRQRERAESINGN